LNVNISNKKEHRLLDWEGQMQSISNLVQRLISLREREGRMYTLLAVCPNSEAVLEAGVLAAARNRTPMLFAATLNQVDRDGGYTGWTQEQFVALMKEKASKEGLGVDFLFPCLDHGGPWLKDTHTIEGLSYEETMGQVKASIEACLRAGYQLLHIDPTVDRDLPEGAVAPIETVVSRTVELIGYAENVRAHLGLGKIAYEVGTEEVHGGLVDVHRFEAFLGMLKAALEQEGLSHAWPCFVVAQVGTDLHTTTFDEQAAARLFEIVSPLGSLVKGHYTDWVDNPQDYPKTGMGGANVGPEFTAREYIALQELCKREEQVLRDHSSIEPSQFLPTLERAVVSSERWLKWLHPHERGRSFGELDPDRQSWLVQTGARYMWTDPSVVEARRRLYHNLEREMADPHAYVVQRVVESIEAYLRAFDLVDSIQVFEEQV
jgi:tagatose-1,6-bisphosphate aldolase non-catalytic subunit AgaZ/GatZ